MQGILSLLEGEEVTRKSEDTPPDGLTALLAQAGTDADSSSRQPIRHSHPQGANKQLIIEAVMQDPGVTAAEIAERTVVSATINRLERNGELEPRVGQGVRVPSGRRLAALAQ